MPLLRLATNAVRLDGPVGIAQPTPAMRRALRLLWMLCFLGVVIVQAGSAWREYVFDTQTQPAFAAVGLVTVRADSRSWFVRPPGRSGEKTQAHAHGSAKPATDHKPKHGPKLFKGRILAVNGQPVAGMSAERVAERIGASPKSAVALTIAHIGKQKRKPPETLILTPSVAQAQRVLARDDRTFKIATQIIDLILAMLLLGTAVIVRLKRFDSITNMAFAFILIFAATVGTSRFWQFIRADQGLYYCYFAWLALLLTTLPAWPDGKYRPRWTRVSLVAGPLIAAAIFWHRKEIEQDSLLTAAALAALALPLGIAAMQRFRSERQRVERQQLKWMFVGFGFGLLCVLAGLLIPEGGGWLPPTIDWAARYVTFILRRAGVLMIVCGLLLSLMRYRLNDTDAVIGRSTGYAALMTALAVVWALGEAFADNAVKSVAGASNPTLSLSISTIVTVAILAPARERMLDWTRSRFQAGLMRLRELPHRLVRWHANSPEELADKAIAAIVAGVHPTRAALAWKDESGKFITLAAYNCDAGEIAARLASDEVGEPAGGLLYRFSGPPDQPPLTLLLGRRSDGASYTREEKAALCDLLDPLAELESSAFLHFNRQRTLSECIEELQGRLQHLTRRRARPAL